MTRLHWSLAAAFLLSPLSARAQILFEDDFESVDASCFESSGARGGGSCGAWSVYWASNAQLAIEDGGTSHSGRRAMRLTFTQNESEGGATMVLDGETHVFTRYWERYAAGFDFACGMKVHRIRSFDGELNAFDTITFSRGVPSSAGNYCGLNDMQSLNVQANGGRPVDWTIWNDYAMERERWYCVEHEILLNSPGASDGAVRIWVDGELLGERTDHDIRADLTAEINRVLFGGWYSNGCGGNPCAAPVTPAVRYIDDVAIARSRIGCEVEPPSTDAGAPVPDAGTDAGLAIDGGTPDVDASTSTRDAAVDAARESHDASRAADGGARPVATCGCGIAPASGAPWALAGWLVGIAALRRRER